MNKIILYIINCLAEISASGDLRCTSGRSHRGSPPRLTRPVVTSVKCIQQLLFSASPHCTAVHSTQPPVFVVFFMRQWKKWISLNLPSTPPFPGLTVKCQMFPQRSPLAVKRVIKVTEFLHKRTSITRTGLICVIILLWHKHLTGKKTLHTSAFYVFQLTEKSRLARQHMMPSRAISKIVTHPKKMNSLLWLTVNLTTTSGEEILLE